MNKNGVGTFTMEGLQPLLDAVVASTSLCELGLAESQYAWLRSNARQWASTVPLHCYRFCHVMPLPMHPACAAGLRA